MARRYCWLLHIACIHVLPHTRTRENPVDGKRLFCSFTCPLSTGCSRLAVVGDAARETQAAVGLVQLRRQRLH